MGVNKTMPTITIDLPDNVSVLHARSFVLEKLHEAGFLPSEQAEHVVEDDVDNELDDDPDSWFTPEMRRRAKENRRQLEEEHRRNPPKRSREEVLHLLVNLSMPDEETIKRQNEIEEMRKRWTYPW
jgi:hypothetical protein